MYISMRMLIQCNTSTNDFVKTAQSKGICQDISEGEELC